MKISNFFTIAALLIFIASCGSNNQQAQYYDEFDAYPTGEYHDADQGNHYPKGDDQQAYYQETNQAKPSKANRGNSKVEMKTIMDNKTGLPYCYMPLPANWKLNANATGQQAAITGPNGVKVYSMAFKSFAYTNDQYMAQLYQQAGQQMRRPIGNDNVKNEFQAEMNKNGYTFVKQYDLPKVAQSDKTYNSKLWKSGPMQSTFGASASEWVNQKGSKILILTHYFEHAGQGLVSWGYYGNAMETPASVFEHASQALIYAATNIRYNDQQIQAYNRSEQQKSNQSWAAHNQRMKNNQANFEATQQAYRSSNDAINKSIMSTYKTQSESFNRGNQQYQNSIHEENTVTNPYDGQQYQVDQNYNQTWMNNNGDYIQSNDAFYNPNGDQNVYQYDWQEVEPQH